MSYGEVLTSAWKIIWKHKVLWIFGILAGLGSGGSSGSGGNSGRSSGSGLNPNDMPWSDGQVTSWLQNNWWLLVVAVILLLLLVAAAVVLGTYGRIGLARGAWEADEGAPRLTFGGLFSQSGRYFVRVILLALLIFVVSLIIIAPMVLFGVLTLGVGLLCLLPVFCVLGLVSWLVQIIVRMAIVAIVGEDLSLMDGLRRGWEVVRGHLAEAIVLGLILGIGGWILGLIIGLPFLLAALPLIFMAVSQSSEVVSGSIIAAVAVVCLYLPVAIFLGGLLESYIGTAWTLAYRRLTGGLPAAVDGALPGL